MNAILLHYKLALVVNNLKPYVTLLIKWYSTKCHLTSNAPNFVVNISFILNILTAIKDKLNLKLKLYRDVQFCYFNTVTILLFLPFALLKQRFLFEIS
ncbi:hypothetical protein SPM24T3_02068 [Serratia sp. M24T3]|nr:hypothetical protein SPM24T3_02068 [Serratia sp. M24T3]